MKYFSLLCSLFLVVSVFTETSAQRLITGRVLNMHTKLPVEGVAISVFRGTAFTTTNQYGNFQMTLNDSDSLILTHPDYKSGGVALPDVDVFAIYIEQYNYYPSYLEGDYSLYTYLQKNMDVSTKAKFLGIESWVFIEVTVDSTGSMTNCRALNEIIGHCEKDVVKVFKAIPGKWSKSDVGIDRRLIFPIELRLGAVENTLDIPDISLPDGKLMSPIKVTTYGVEGQIGEY